MVESAAASSVIAAVDIIHDAMVVEEKKEPCITNALYKRSIGSASIDDLVL